MIAYLLDTNICIYAIHGHNADLLKRLRSIPPDNIGLSSITLAELAHGVEKSRHVQQNRDALRKFIAPFVVRAFGSNAAAHYGKIRAVLEQSGQTIGPMDYLIAAQALAENAVLITNNEREFRRVPGLVVENWV